MNQAKKERQNGGGAGGEFYTQPRGPRGVSNCVIKYVTGSKDVSAEAWSPWYYCAEACNPQARACTCTNTARRVQI